jgi:murein DD-endopeptidase MepM/ murein hydrolase activator NlpD
MQSKHRRRSTAMVLVALAMAAGPAGAAGPRPAPSAGTSPAGGFEAPRDNLSPAADRAMLEEIDRNVARLRRAGLPAPQRRAEAVTYDFPLRLAPGLPGEAGYYVSALADHDPAAGKVLDYNGGNRTYDSHRGIDIALWPFPWNKLDAGEVQVLAAAAGTIVAKADTNAADHHCGNGADGGDWNYVALEHADGRMTIYGHLRHLSLTAKAIGQTVARGEVLATAGSSGNSSGPHLHFEVRVKAFAKEWIDPYAGPHSQPESLWTAQRPYIDPAINLLAVHEGPPSNPDPCLPSLTRFKDHFTVPANVYLYAYYRDFQGNLPTEVSVFRPDGTVFRSWTFTDDTAFIKASSHGWVAQLAAGEQPGAWRVEATYNGQSHQATFTVEGAAVAPTATVAPTTATPPTATVAATATTVPPATVAPTASGAPTAPILPTAPTPATAPTTATPPIAPTATASGSRLWLPQLRRGRP